MRRPHTYLAVALLLAIAACGGSGETTATSKPADVSTATADAFTTTTADPAPPEAPTETSERDLVEEAAEAFEDSVDSAGGSATVTIGDQTWEFAIHEGYPLAACDAAVLGDGFLAVLSTSADLMSPHDAVKIQIPPSEVGDTPLVEVNLQTDERAKWIASEEIYERSPNLPPGIGVTDFSIDGNAATGTGLFYEENSLLQSGAGTGDLLLEKGSFEVSCVAE